jgi:hypothetical protein
MHVRARTNNVIRPFVLLLLHRKCTPSFLTRLFISKLHKLFFLLDKAILLHSSTYYCIITAEINESLTLRETCAHLTLHAPNLQSFVHKLV